MNSSNDRLINFAERQLKQVSKRAEDSVGFLFNHLEFEKLLFSLLQSQNEKIESIEKEIDIVNFRKFLRSPQINDLMIEYMFYLVSTNFSSKVMKKKIWQDDIINYFVKVIETHFPDLAQENTLISIRSYFDILMNICSTKWDNKIYSDIVEIMDGKIVQPSFIVDYLSENTTCNINLERIDMIMKHDFIMRDSKFENIKKDYSRSLKQYYQNGFIYLLGEYKFNEFYIPPILVNGHKSRQMFWRQFYHMDKSRIERFRENWKNIFNNQYIIYVIGGAGYGKSLFLRNIINNYAKLNIANSQDYLLIYCDLKTYYTNGNVSKKTMVDFFQESMISMSGIDDISKEFIRYYLNIGRCIVLLDALDEVPKDVRNDLHKKIMAFFATCNLNNRVCITSRDRGFLPQQDIEVLEIVPLTERDIEDYIEKMINLKKFKREEKETFMKQASALIEKEFLNNFLILSLLVNIYKAEKELPENKIDLYKKCFEYIAKKREEEKSKTGYDWKSIYPLMKDSTFISLSVLAAPNNKDIKRERVEELLLRQYKNKYPDEVTAECAIKEFLEFCSNRTELFVPASVDDKFKFFHRSFFEYFYSRYIHQQPEIEKMYQLMAGFDVDSEVFELTVALVKEDNEEKYQQLIDFIFEKVKEEFSGSMPDSTAFGILTLAMQVIDDAYYIRKYYEIIMSYSDLMSKDKICEMNQRLMCMWIDKEIGSDSEKIKEFVGTFSNQCVQYVLTAMAEIRMSQYKDKQLINLDSIMIDEEPDIRFAIDMSNRIRNIPFYLMLCSKYNRLYDLMEECMNNGIASFNIKGTKKSTLKKGLYNYKQLSQDERQRVLTMFCKLR